MTPKKKVVQKATQVADKNIEVTDEMYQPIADLLKETIQEVKVTKNIRYQDLSIEQYTFIAQVANKNDIPITMISAWIDDGRLVYVVQNEALLMIARRQEGYLSIISNAVYPGDDFEMDMATGTITKHVIHPEKIQPEEKPLGAYSILRMKDREPQSKWVYWHEYEQEKSEAWKKKKSAMISKCASSALTREAFGLSGLYGEEEISQKTTTQKLQKANQALKKDEPEDTIEEEVFKKRIREYIEDPKSNQVLAEGLRKKLSSPGYTETQAKKDCLLIDQQ